MTSPVNYCSMTTTNYYNDVLTKSVSVYISAAATRDEKTKRPSLNLQLSCVDDHVVTIRVDERFVMAADYFKVKAACCSCPNDSRAKLVRRNFETLNSILDEVHYCYY